MVPGSEALFRGPLFPVLGIAHQRIESWRWSMSFDQGQRVRIRGKEFIGIVEKKLLSLDNVYAVVIDNISPQEEKLVRGEDLEVFLGERGRGLPEGEARA